MFTESNLGFVSLALLSHIDLLGVLKSKATKTDINKRRVKLGYFSS